MLGSGVFVSLFFGLNTSRCHSKQQGYLKHWAAYADIPIMHKQSDFFPAPFLSVFWLSQTDILTAVWTMINHLCSQRVMLAKVLSPDSGDQRCNHVTWTWFSDDFDLIMTATFIICGFLCVEASRYYLYRWCLPLAGELIHCLAANSWMKRNCV